MAAEYIFNIAAPRAASHGLISALRELALLTWAILALGFWILLMATYFQ
ncbi:MAG: hypothetical protein ACHQIL_00750 [Steroidobacterales bacterium]